MPHKILIPLDESLMSRRIFTVVTEFLRPEDNKLILFQVIHPAVEYIDIPPAHAGDEWMPAMYRYFEEKQKLSHEAFLQQQADLRQSLAEALTEEAEPLRDQGYEVEATVQYGEPVEQIERYIQHRHIDLIAMATHGREGIGRILYGSVSGAIIHDLNVPVLLLHPPGV